MTAAWEPPYTIEEKLKYGLLPASLYMSARVRKERRRGEAELALLPILCDPARVSLDIGANKGVYSWVMRHHSSMVHAFEPNPKMFRILSRISGPRLLVSPYALSDTSGSARLRIPGNERTGYSNQGGSLSDVKVASAYREVEVQTRTLDELAIPDVGFIKIDVEGHEQAVLAGARQTLARNRPALLIEMEERHTGRPIEEALQQVASLGYRGLFLFHGRIRSTAEFDGDRHHRGAVGGIDYVYNFVFLPE